MTIRVIHVRELVPDGGPIRSLGEVVPVRRAITLTWHAPEGAGPWLLIERGYDSNPVTGTHTISEAGVIRRRFASERRANEACKQARREAHGRTAIYNVVHESDVEKGSSDAPYGCEAG